MLDTRRLVLVTFLVATLATAVLAAGQTTGGGFKVRVTEVNAGFGPEAWKDEGAAAGDLTKTLGLPTGSVVYRNPYAVHGPHTAPTGPVNAWGYNMTLVLELTNSQGQSVQDPGNNLFIEATIRGAGGTIPAKLTKVTATQFEAQFDLDGEAGAPWAALLSGAYTIEIDVFRQDPGVQPEKVGTDAIPLTFGFSPSNLAAFNLPRGALQVYSDLGNVTPLHGVTLNPDDVVSLTFDLGAPNTPARVTLAHGRDLVVLHRGPTDPSGAVTVDLKPADVIGDAAGGLLAVNAHLTGMGGLTGNAVSVGHGLVLLPVAGQDTVITGINRETRSPSNASEDPTSTIRVTVWDPDATPQAGAKYGRLVVMSGGSVLENVVMPPTEPGGDINHKYARFPASTIREEGLSSYMVHAFLFNEANEFYGYASATRGLGVSLGSVDLVEGERGVLPIIVRNLNTNGDTSLDHGLALTAAVQVRGLPGGGTWQGEVTVDEGSSITLDIPVQPSRSGGQPVEVNATAAELTLERSFSVTIAGSESGFRGALQGLLEAPAAGAYIVAGALGVAAVALGRRGPR